ncbi:MAG TPA: Tad domain-containing protein [Anaerolineae bacterium]
MALLLMLAIAVDIGRLYVARQYLINSCDASALAGGMELPNQAKATTQASKCAGANSMTTYQISFPTDGLSAGMDKIRVDGQLNVQYAFAGIIGQKSRTVSAYAIVSRTAGVSWAKQVVPWGMPYYDAKGVPYHYDNGVLYTLKMGSGDDHVGGNFQALALGGTGGSVYRDNIASGYDGVLRVGDWISSETGNMVGPTGQGVDSRMQQASVPPWVDDTWNNHDYGNPRILIVPIISPLSNGRADVQIIGFAAFWLDSFKGQEVKGYFLSYTIPDAGGSGPADYGVSTFQLFE